MSGFGEKIWFSLLLAEATSIATAGCIASALLVFRIGGTKLEQALLGGIIVLLSTGFAAWWMFKRLRVRLSMREARAVTIAFILCVPISLSVAVVLGELSGAYAERFLGTPFALVGAIAGVFVVAPLGSIAPTALTLWMTRRIIRLEATDA